MRRPQDAFNITFEPIVEEVEESEVIQNMIKNNKVHLLYDAMGKEVPTPIKKERVKTVKSGGGGGEDSCKTIHSLFEYTKKEFIDKMRLDYEEIHATFSERARPLLQELEDDKAIIMEIIDTFVNRMVLNLIVHDKVALKARTDMVDRIESLYDHRNGVPVTKVKNDFANYDYVNECLSRRCKESRDQETDELYARFSEPKKRGRHPKMKTEEVINEIETIAGEYIAKRLTLVQSVMTKPPTTNSGDSSPNSSSSSGGSSVDECAPVFIQKAGSIDYYPIFQQVLETYNRCTPKLNNHGFYIQRLLHFIRVLDSRQWPLHGLMSIANNMNYCVHAETVKMHFDRTKKRFYCCYSGLEIQNNETVTYLRVVENDATRLKEWRENPILMGKPFESPEFTRSIAAFYLKKELCCPSTLFYTPFTDTYKAKFPDYFDAATTTKTTKCSSTATTAAATKKKRVLKPKRKALEPLPIVIDDDEEEKEPVTKKARLDPQPARIVLTDIRCDDDDDDNDDNLFESLAMYATEPVVEVAPLTNLRTCMSSLLHRIEVDNKWYGCEVKEESLPLIKRYKTERDVMHGLLDLATKKSCLTVIKEMIGHAMVDDSVSVDHCYVTLLDFIEAVIVPEKKLSSFAVHQTNVVMRVLLHEARRHARGRALSSLFIVTNVDEMVHSSWFKTCPILFMALFDYMSKHDLSGLLKKK